MTGPRPQAPPSSFATHRPVAIGMLFVAAVVFGWFSYQRLAVTLMPEMSYPTITVRTEFAGAAPEEVENDVSRPIEEALGVIGGLQKISSISRAGVSDVVLEFRWDSDIREATQDVLERLDLVFLPDEATRPLILHFDPSLDPVLELSLSSAAAGRDGPDELRRLRRLADLQVKRSIETVKGVAAVRVKGGLEEEIHVWLAEDKLRQTGLSIDEVIRRLAQENINVAGGTIQEGRTEYLVRTLNEYGDLDQIAQTIVASPGGRDIRVADLGEVRWGNKDRQIATRTDGAPSVQLEVFKEADANIVDLARRVEALVGEPPAEGAELAAAGGGGKGDGGLRRAANLSEQLLRDEQVRLKLVADRSVFIESSVNEVRNTAVLGGLLAILVLYLFLRDFRTTAIIAVSIPVSLLVTFAPLHLSATTLNIMSLGGLALGIGMLVDSSIVVLESVHRCREEGDGLVDAAIRGTLEVRSAVLASTLTSIAVFFPMVFVEGVAGQAFGDLGVAVVFSLLASAAVALYLIPMLASRRGIGAKGDPDDMPAGRRGVDWGHWGAWGALRAPLPRRRWYQWLLLPPRLVWRLFRFLLAGLLELVGKLVMSLLLLGTALVTGVLAPALAAGVRLLSFPLRWLTDRGMGALQRSYPGMLRNFVRSPGAVLATLVACLLLIVGLGRQLDSELLPEVRQGEFTLELALPVGTPLEETDRLLRPVERAILDEVEGLESLIVTVGYDPRQSDRSDEGEHTARFKFLLDDAHRGRAHEDRIAERLRQRLAAIPDLDAQLSRPVLFSQKTPIEVEVYGDDLLALRRKAAEVEDELAGMPQLADVHSTLQPGAPEVQVVYDRERLSRYGLNIGQVARLVRAKVQGDEATRFNRVDRRIPVVVRLDEADRRSVEDVAGLVVNPGGDRPIPLDAVAQVVIGEGPSEVRRIDSRRVAVVRANIAEGSMGGAAAAIVDRLQRRVEWPAQQSFVVAGQNEEWERSRGSLLLALGLSIFLVYVIMAVQFENLLHPLVIMFSIPLAFVGTLLALWLLAIPLSVVVFLGMIMLAGIVVNNAIVLVDYINQLRARGLPREEAIVEAGRIRLRPILMTTATTVLGLLPMALGQGDGAEIRTPMALAVITGLISSTLLTLLVIPGLYAAADGFVARFTGGEQPAPVPAPAPVAGAPGRRGEGPLEA